MISAGPFGEEVMGCAEGQSEQQKHVKTNEIGWIEEIINKEKARKRLPSCLEEIKGSHEVRRKPR
jgi:hypothetical protein